MIGFRKALITPKMTATLSSVMIFFGVSVVSRVMPVTSTVATQSATAVMTTLIRIFTVLMVTRPAHGLPHPVRVFLRISWPQRATQSYYWLETYDGVSGSVIRHPW